MLLGRQQHIESGLESTIYRSIGPWRRLSFLECVVHWILTHLIILSPLAGQGRRLIGCTFPSRAGAFAVGGFWILSIILSVVGYRTFQGNI
jgi:ferric-chelate reductase